MLVKICGLTNAADAEFAAAEGADYLGFVVHPPSPRHCTDLAGASREVRERAVLVTVADDADIILRLANSAGIRNVQPYVPMDRRVQVIQRLKSEGYFIMLPWVENGNQTSLPADIRIWESDPKETGVEGGSGRTHTLDQPPPGPFLLAGGLDAGNLRERLALMPSGCRTNLCGFDAASRLELAPGIKAPLKVRAFIQTAKSIAGEVLHARD